MYETGLKDFLPSQCPKITVQGHAVDTYDEFVEANKEKLQGLPPPLVALKYYKGGDLYYFDALQTKGGNPRRPDCR